MHCPMIRPGLLGLAVEGVILAVTLAGLAFVLWRNKLLTKKARQQQQQQMQQYHWQQPPSSRGGTLSEVGPYGYGSPVDTEPAKMSELHSAGLAYTELPGEPIGHRAVVRSKNTEESQQPEQSIRPVMIFSEYTGSYYIRGTFDSVRTELHSNR
ncbi:hypothetical protein F4818DRAFT_442186 [Hypoxylon cercidicola]|nr:hypothetical protein F4818DRAFT_442186 [Hypoxylon cercidicola]